MSSLETQLHQIKRRLWPTAIECAAAMKSKTHTEVYSTRDAFEEARRMCNPFEELGEGRRGGLNKLFVNRSAVKLANLDAMLGFILTPSYVYGMQNEKFEFADLCGAPGG